MSTDAFNNFLKGSPQPPAPVVATSAPTPPATGGAWSGILLAVVLFAGLWYVDSQGWLDAFKGGGDQQQQQEQKQDQYAAGVKPGTLYMVHDLKSAPADRVLLVQEVKAMRAATSGFEYRQYDDDDDTPTVKGIIQHAESKGVKPPFVAFKPAGKEIAGVMAWPKDKSELMKVFK